MMLKAAKKESVESLGWGTVRVVWGRAHNAADLNANVLHAPSTAAFVNRQVVASVGNYVRSEERGIAGQVFILFLLTADAHFLEDLLDLECFQTRTAFEIKLKQLALFMISS
jgi:hypothetical protein